MPRFLSIGECMVEFSMARDPGLWQRRFAGDTFNTLWHLTRHLDSSWQGSYLTCLGNDSISADMLAWMQQAHINVSDIRIVPGAVPGLYTIALDGAERSFTYWRSVAAARQLADDPNHLREAIEAADEIYFSGITMGILSDEARGKLVEALAQAKAVGKQVSFDPNIRPRLWTSHESMLEWTEKAGRVSTRAFPTFDDEGPLFDDGTDKGTAQRYHDWGAGEVVVKNGPEACLVSLAGGVQAEVPACEVLRPVDTTGAGDSFNAGYLAARLKGVEPADACRRGHSLAAQVITHSGAIDENVDYTLQETL